MIYKLIKIKDYVIQIVTIFVADINYNILIGFCLSKFFVQKLWGKCVSIAFLYERLKFILYHNHVHKYWTAPLEIAIGAVGSIWEHLR